MKAAKAATKKKKKKGDTAQNDRLLQNCQFCHSGENEDKLLLCDSCDKGYHTYCFKPRMDKIPEGDWWVPSSCFIPRLINSVASPLLFQVLLRVREQGDGGAQVHRLRWLSSGARRQDAALRAVSARLPPRLSHTAADQGAEGQVVLPRVCVEGTAAKKARAEEQGPTAADTGHADNDGESGRDAAATDAQVGESELDVAR